MAVKELLDEPRDDKSVVVLDPQLTRHLDQLLHRIVAGLDDARRQEQPLDIVPLVEVQRQLDDLIDTLRPLDTRSILRRRPVMIFDDDANVVNWREFRNLTPRESWPH